MRWIIGWVGLLNLSLGASWAAEFTPPELPAKGLQQATLSISTPGVHALWAEHPQGVALRLVDRTTGPGAWQGEAGVRNGRVNALLGSGDYRVQTQASAAGSGMVKLQLRAYREQHASAVPLAEFQPVTTQLGDFEQRSYTFTLTEPRQVQMVAGGRALDSVRLWQAGQWLVPSSVRQEQIEPQPGQPQTIIMLSASLNPGQYQLSLYGGQPLPWTQAAEQSPLQVVWGLPRLPESYRGTHALDALGRADYLVPASSRHFRLELPKAGTLQFRLRAYDPAQPHAAPALTRTLRVAATPPVLSLNLDQLTGEAEPALPDADAEPADASEPSEQAELHDDEPETGDETTPDPAAGTEFAAQQVPASGYYWVEIQGQAGQVYTLQQLPKTQNPYPISGSGEYWLSVVHTGAASDQLSANAILTATDAKGRTTLVRQQSVDLDGNRTWQGQFNLEGEFSLLVQVPQATEYQFVTKGDAAEARLRLVPFLADAQTPLPAYRPAGGKWKLAPGVYWLQGEAVEPGLLELSLKPVKPGKKPTVTALNSLAAVGFPVNLSADQRYNLWLNTQPGIQAGVSLRALPLDLRQPLPLAQGPGEWTAPEIEVSTPGMLEAVTETGARLELSLTGMARWKTQLELQAGVASNVKVRHTGKQPVAYVLRFTPQPAPLASAELPPPNWPVLSLNQTVAAQLPVQGQQIYTLNVPSAGMYQFSSQGLLALNGSLRSRWLPGLQQARQNGAGRNFILHDYLNPGEYQLGVQAEGQAQGAYSLRAQTLPLRDGGWLRPDQAPAFTQLAAGEALQLRLRIETAGTYRLEILGLQGRSFQFRLEDREGWPVLPPQSGAPLETALAAGEYRVLILPQVLPARLTARLDSVRPPVVLTGHGPHPLAWNTAQAHVWEEPAEGAPRLPDRWQFGIPAALEVTLSLPAELRAELLRPDAGTNTPVATFVGGKPWTGLLQRGQYELRVQALSQNNRLPYQIQLQARQFAAGQSLTLTLPADITLRVAGDELLELNTWGTVDTRLRVYDAQQRLIAEQDDGPLGWNVQWVAALPMGEYRLRLEQASGDLGLGETPAVQTQLSARAWPVTTVNPLKANERRQLRLNQAYRLPLLLNNAAALLATAQAGGPMGMAISREAGDAPWLAQQTGEQLSIPWLPAAQTRYQLWLWPLGSATEASVEWRSLAEQPLSLDALRAGLPAKANGAGVYRLELPTPATVTAPTAPPRLQASSGPEQVFRPLQETHFAAAGKLWLWPGSGQATPGLNLESLEVPLQADLPLALPAQSLTRLTVGGRGEGVRVVVAEASRGLPLVRWQGNEASLPGLAWETPAASASASLDATQTQVELWRGDGESYPLQARLSQYRYPDPPPATALTLGPHDLPLTPGQARRYTLPDGPLTLHLSLPARTVALTSQGNRVSSTHYSGTQTRTETLTTDADTLWLLPLDTTPGSVRVQLESVVTLERLTSGQILTRQFTGPGIWQFPIRLPEAEQQAQLRLHALGGRLTYLSADQHQQDLDQAVQASGTVRLTHEAGMVAVWLAGASEALDPWLHSPMRRVDMAKPVQTVKLDDAAQTLRLEVPAPRLLHLRSATPLLLALRTAKGEVTARHFPQGVAWDIGLPQGLNLLSIRPGYGETLDASTLHLAVRELPLLTEGLNAPVLLMPGSQALFRIALAQPAKLGVGASADPDGVITVLRQADGTLLGRGAVQWHELTAGTYTLALEAPLTGGPVLARPAVVGLVAPSRLPPAEILRSYLSATP